MKKQIFKAKYGNGHIAVWLVDGQEHECDVIRFELAAIDREGNPKRVGADLAADEALYLAFGLFKATFTFLGQYTDRLRQIHLKEKEER